MDIGSFLELGESYCDAVESMNMPVNLKEVYRMAKTDRVATLAVALFGMFIDGDDRFDDKSKKLIEGFYGIEDFVDETIYHLTVHSMSGVHSGSSSESGSSAKHSRISSQDSPHRRASTINCAGSGSSPPL